jgi:hypothetical protein
MANPRMPETSDGAVPSGITEVRPGQKGHQGRAGNRGEKVLDV